MHIECVAASFIVAGTDKRVIHFFGFLFRFSVMALVTPGLPQAAQPRNCFRYVIAVIFSDLRKTSQKYLGSEKPERIAMVATGKSVS